MKASELREELDRVICEFGDADIYIVGLNKRESYIEKGISTIYADNQALWYRICFGECVPYKELQKKYSYLLPESNK